METNESQDVDISADEEADEPAPQPSDDINALKTRLQRLEEKQIQARERNRMLRQEITKLRGQSVKTDSEPSKPADDGLSQKAFLRSAGISKAAEVELALTTAKKWDMPIDKLVDDEDFQAKLEKLRTQEANLNATSGISGSPGTQSAKLTPEYWLAKGIPPSAQDVPDRKIRAKIARAMMDNVKNGKTFYND